MQYRDALNGIEAFGYAFIMLEIACILDVRRETRGSKFRK